MLTRRQMPAAGAVGDMGIHNAAMVMTALRLGPPVSAEPATSPTSPRR